MFPFCLDRVFFEHFVAPSAVWNPCVFLGDGAYPLGRGGDILARTMMEGYRTDVIGHHTDRLRRAPVRPMTPSHIVFVFALISDSDMPIVTILVGSEMRQ